VSCIESNDNNREKIKSVTSDVYGPVIPTVDTKLF
jgi:hypothetical protein